MLSLAHISDLHFCEPTLKEALRQFAGGVSDRFARLAQADIPNIHVASPDVLEALRMALTSLDPSVIVISGDITTFGDESSFAMFTEWCKPLAARTGGRPDRKILLVPGNHDALRDHFTYLYREIIPAVAWYLRLAAHKYIRLLDPLIPHLGASWAESNHLASFHSMLSANPWLSADTIEVDVPDCSGVRVRLIPFSTTCSDPLWMNLAETHLEDWQRLQNEVRTDSRVGADVKIVVAHHNPVAPPSGKEGRFAHAYNGMPEGSLFLAELQRAGVDLVIHGHQHEYSLLKFDYDHGSAGHAFALGCDCSTSSSSGGFNLLRITDPNNVDVQRFQYSKQAGFKAANAPFFLPLERHRPVDADTLSARYELKQYLYPSGDDLDADAFGPVQRGSRGIVYMSGRHFRSVREAKFAQVRQVLQAEDARVRLLLVDPDLVSRLRKVEHPTTGVDGASGDLWGRKEELERLEFEAKNTFSEVGQFVASLTENQRARIEVRKAHTLIPFGAYVRDPDKPWGKMVLKLLPVGGIGDLQAPVLRLNRRSHRALYNYYLKHLKYLFLRSAHVVGDWHDLDDLKNEMEPDLLESVAHQP